MVGRGPARALLSPPILLALALWALNDHVLKAALSNALTGKLSDVASLMVFPLLPVAALELWREKRGAPPPGNAHLVAWVLATGFVMATINTLDGAAFLYRHGLGALQWPALALHAALGGRALPPLHTVHLTMDPSDLFTLPALLVPLSMGWRARPADRLDAASRAGALRTAGAEARG